LGLPGRVLRRDDAGREERRRLERDHERAIRSLDRRDREQAAQAFQKIEPAQAPGLDVGAFFCETGAVCRAAQPGEV